MSRWQAHRPDPRSVLDSLREFADWAIVAVFVFGAAYFMAHILVIAGVPCGTN